MLRLLLALALLPLSFARLPIQEPPPQGDGYALLLPLVTLNRPPEWIGPEGGLISAVVVNPQAPETVYAASWGGGVYKSQDGGRSWAWASRGLDNLTVVSLALNPKAPDTLYAGTYHGKLFKSTDGAQSWVLSSAGVQERAIVYSIAVDPFRPATVYMATRGLSNEVTPPWAGVIYRSDDSGATWKAVLDDLGGSHYQDWAYTLAVHPTLPDLLFAATHEQGIIVSEDRGETWRTANSGITNFSTRALVFGPSDQVYTAVWEKKGVFKSDDLGATWTLQDNGTEGAQIYVMDMDPSWQQTLYLATYNMGVLKTTNGGRRWGPSGLAGVPIATVRVHPTQPQRVFAGTSGDGLYASPDNGETWARSQSGLNASSAVSMLISPLNEQVYFAGVYGSGVLRSPDRGKTWEAFNQNLDTRWINALVEQPERKTLYALTYDQGLFRCDLTKPGDCWQPVSVPGGVGAPAGAVPAQRLPVQRAFRDAAGLDSLSAASIWPTGPGLLALAFAPSNPDIAYLGGAGTGVLRSTDGGRTWQGAGLPGRTIWSLAVDPQDPQRVFAATDQPGTVRLSTDGGRNWSDASLPGVSGYSLAFFPGPSGGLLAGTSSGLYRLDGSAWKPAGLEGAAIIALAPHPENPQYWYAGAAGGAYLSKDGGASWLPGPEELQSHTVQAVYTSPLEPEYIYYCTSAHGILRAAFEP